MRGQPSKRNSKMAPKDMTQQENFFHERIEKGAKKEEKKRRGLAGYRLQRLNSALEKKRHSLNQSVNAQVER